MEPLETLKVRIKETRDNLSATVAGGGAKDMNDYARMTSRIRTFEDVLTEIADIEKRYLDE